ncbi:hypothetical protein VIGAN_03139600, partial [Vigna angularis var. angularis]
SWKTVGNIRFESDFNMNFANRKNQGKTDSKKQAAASTFGRGFQSLPSNRRSPTPISPTPSNYLLASSLAVLTVRFSSVDACRTHNCTKVQAPSHEFCFWESCVVVLIVWV